LHSGEQYITIMLQNIKENRLEAENVLPEFPAAFLLL
jgi:hypothetical protein